jgi:hypothetical protein
LPGEPLIFVEVALTTGLSSSVQPLLAHDDDEGADLPWDDAANTTARLINISRPARDQMDVSVHNGLSGRLAAVHAYVEAFNRFVSSEDVCSDF